MKKILLILSLITTSAFATEIDIKKSIITWKGSKITGDKHSGRIHPKSGNVKLVKGILSSGEIVIDLKEITVTDLKGEWATKFLGHMKSKDFFNVGKYPTAKLKITSVDKKKATGDLTIMGKIEKVTFPIKKTSNKYEGTLSFNRTKFGMVYGSSNFLKNLGDKVINDLVEVTFEIYLK
jgi:polyisoprenoid-binding protein YceI